MVDFNQVRVAGTESLVPTSLQWGPDGRLYVSEYLGPNNARSGVIKVFDVARDDAGQYKATLVETIDAVSKILNHDDDGTPRPTLTGRLVTGFQVVGTAENPIIFVTSSDPRTGGGANSGDAGDKNLDTNSGTISELIRNASGGWDKIDLVRGLPRSEEKHTVNGVIYDQAENALFVSVGGNTNSGAPSEEFAYAPDYALSGAILKIRLDVLSGMDVKTDAIGHKYLYDLPTLDDPTRPNDAETGEDVAGATGATGVDPFGGNDGLNQAKWLGNTADNPVHIYATGFRNAYDLVRTQDGNLLTFDNGGNTGWGGPPIPEIVDGKTVYTNKPNDSQSVTSNQDQLHLIEQGGYYGHPNAVRASGAASGFYDSAGNKLPTPVDMDTVVPGLDPREGVFLKEKTQDGALYLSSKSTNGLTEYTYAGANNGEMVGNLFATRLAANALVRVILKDTNGDGKPDTATGETITLQFTDPLDVVAQGANQPFAGSLWVASQTGSGKGIWVLEPLPGPPGGPPAQPDRDGDGVADVKDPFAFDADNGRATVLHAGETLVWDFDRLRDPSDLPGGKQGLGTGLTGLMVNGTDLPETLGLGRLGLPTDEVPGDDVIIGAAGNSLQIGFVPDGTAVGSANGQLHAYQAGFLPQAERFTLVGRLVNPLPAITHPDSAQGQGVYLGTGDQDSFVKITLGFDRDVDGTVKPVVEVVYEEDGVMLARERVFDPRFLQAAGNGAVELRLVVDKVLGTVTPTWSIDTTGGSLDGQGDTIVLRDDSLSALQGTYTLPTGTGSGTSAGTKASGMAWGVIASSAGPAEPFTAQWRNVELRAEADAPKAEAWLQVNGDNNSNILGVSTFTAHSFRLTNTGDARIKSMTLDLADGVMPQVLYDTTGTAGDVGNVKPFTVDSAGNTGVTNASATMSNPYQGGYRTMKVDFAGFDPGETMTFSMDLDPKSAAGLGSGSEPGAVNGLEMSGARVVIEFTDGTTVTQAAGQLFSDGSVNGAEALIRGGGPAGAVAIDVGGIGNGGTGTVTGAVHTVSLDGPAHARIRVVVLEGDVVPDGNATIAGRLGPYEFNAAIGRRAYDVILDGDGHGQVNVQLTNSDYSDPNDGLNVVMAAVVTADGTVIGSVSAPVHLRLDVPAPADTTRPTATGTVPDLTGTNQTHTITVTYADAGGSGLDAGTIGTDDIVVTGPSEVTVQSVTTKTNNNGSVTATYVVAATGGFTAASNGAYSVELVSGSVLDGATNGVAAKTLASFTVDIPTGGPSNGNPPGTEGADTLTGTGGADLIFGLGGNDVLKGQGGADTLDGGPGNDKIDGGTGADLMRGGTGNDIFYVDNPGDQVVELAGGGTDRVESTVSYTLAPEVEALLLRGSSNLDATGHDGANTLTGNGGANILTGGGGLDMLTGGAGADIFVLDAPTGSSADTITDFASADRIRVAAGDYGLAIGAGLTGTGALDPAWFATGAANAAHGQFVFETGTRRLLWDADGTGAGAGVLLATIGTATAVTAAQLQVVGGEPPPAPDTTPPAFAASAADVSASALLHPVVVTYSDPGGTGILLSSIGVGDLVVNGPHAVTVQSVSTEALGGGTVRATYFLASGADGFTPGDNGAYTVSLADGAVSDIVGNTTAASPLVEFQVAVSSGPTNGSPPGTAGADTLTGTAGADIIYGLGGNDTLKGQGGNDQLNGGDGNDKIDGGTGADTMAGGAGNDIFYVDNAGDIVFEAPGEGTDKVESTVTYTVSANIETLVLRGSGDIGGTGNDGANTIQGNSGSNVLRGAGGADILAGGGGNDTLEGGAGNDTFVFNTVPGAGNVDTILDFSVADDVIQLENAVFKALPTTGPLAASAFHLGTAASDAADRIVYDAGTGDLFYDADGNGALVQTRFAVLTPGLDLSHLDFLVI